MYQLWNLDQFFPSNPYETLRLLTISASLDLVRIGSGMGSSMDGMIPVYFVVIRYDCLWK